MARTLDFGKNYKSVGDYFGDFDPIMAIILDEPGNFWPGVKSNTTSTLELATIGIHHVFTGDTSSKQFLACALLIFGRIIGLIPTPE